MPSGSPSANDARIRFVIGDATASSGIGPKVIVHVCNDVGAWGAGFVLALSRRWPEPEAEYRSWSRGKGALPFELGQVQIIRVSSDIEVANMIGQRGIRREGGRPPVRYDAIERALNAVAAHCLRQAASVHMPRIGCGLAGGKWAEIEPLILSQLVYPGVSVTVYDLA